MISLLKRIVMLLIVLVTTGCASNKSNLSPLQLTLGPEVDVYRDPRFKSETYRTFAVFPYSEMDKEQKTNPILEKQMLFALRNMMEALGYIFVDRDMSPDLLITIDAKIHYKEFDVPAQQVSIPKWIPDQEITSTGASSGYISGLGSYSGLSTTRTTKPGYLTSETYNIPGYSTGTYFPDLLVVAYDRRTKSKIWSGKGVGASNNNDLRISSQWVLKKLIGGNFPASAFSSEQTSECKGEEGLGLSVLTVDGNNYFPAVLYVFPGSPANEAGIEVNDLIIAINGTLTANKSTSEIIKLQCGKEGEKLTLRLFRDGKQFEVSMVRANRDELLKVSR